MISNNYELFAMMKITPMLVESHSIIRKKIILLHAILCKSSTDSEFPSKTIRMKIYQESKCNAIKLRKKPIY